MKDVKELDDIHMMGFDQATYEQLLKIARQENKSVSEVASEALKRHLEEKSQTKKTEKRLLVEG